MSEYYTTKDIASAVGLDPSSARKALRSCQIFPVRKKANEQSKGQRCDVYSQEQFDEFVRFRADQGYDAERFDRGPRSESGYFYVIALIPEYNPARLKFGFATSISDRLSAHRTAAPTAVLLRSWPARRHWELPAIECATRDGAKRIGLESFDVENVQDTLNRIDELFSLLPSCQTFTPTA